MYNIRENIKQYKVINILNTNSTEINKEIKVPISIIYYPSLIFFINFSYYDL